MNRTIEISSRLVRGQKLSLLLAVALLTLLFPPYMLSGCGGSVQSLPSTPPGSPAALAAQTVSRPRPTNTTVVAARVTSSPRTYVVEADTESPSTVFNPLAENNYATQRVLDNLFDSLVIINAETATVSPGLASEWITSSNDVTTTFKLNPTASWHDGEPVTAEDVAFTFQTILDPDIESPLKANLVDVDTFFALDEKTFAVILDEPNCSALHDIGLIPIIPQHIFAAGEGNDPASARERLLAWDTPVGTGPFKFAERLTSGEVRLERNDKYFAGPPQITGWLYRPLSDRPQLFSMLRSGEVDLARLSATDMQQFQPAEAEDIVGYAHPEYYTLILNTTRPKLSDVRTRRALALALDRTQMVQELLNGHGQVIDTSWLPDHWAYPALDSPAEYAPEQARELLSEAGWVDTDGDGLLDRQGSPLNIAIAVNSENDLRKQIARATQRYWINAGISAEVHFVEFHTLIEKLFARNFDVTVWSWPVHQDPDQSVLWASEESGLDREFNFSSYANPVVDEALLAGLTAPACDPDTRADAYREAISAIAGDQPYIFLFVPQDFVVKNRRLSGVKPGPYGSLSWNINEWAIASEDVSG